MKKSIFFAVFLAVINSPVNANSGFHLVHEIHRTCCETSSVPYPIGSDEVLVSTSYGIRVFNLITGQQTQQISIPGVDNSEGRRVAVSPDGTLLAALSIETDRGMIYDLKAKAVKLRLKEQSEQERGYLRQLLYSQDGKKIVGAYEKSVCYWNAENGRAKGCDDDYPVAQGLGLSNNRTANLDLGFIVNQGHSGSEGYCYQKVSVWNLSSKVKSFAFDSGLSCYDDEVALDIVSVDKQLVTVEQTWNGLSRSEQRLNFWDLNTGARINRGWSENQYILKGDVLGPIFGVSIRVSPDNSIIAIHRGGSEKIQLLSLTNGELVQELLLPDHQIGWGITFSRDSKRLYVGGENASGSDSIISVFEK